MAQYFADQMANLINEPNVVYPRNTAYEKYMFDLENRQISFESQLHSLNLNFDSKIKYVDAKIESVLDNFILKNSMFRSIFKHFPKIGHLSHMNDQSIFTMIVHEGTGEDFCADGKLEEVFYEHNSGVEDIRSHMRMYMKKDEYERFVYFIAQEDLATFSTWRCYEFNRLINKEYMDANIVDDCMIRSYELYRMLPEDGIQYDYQLNLDQNTQSKKFKYYPKTYDTDELAQMSNSELDKFIRNNMNAYDEIHNPSHYPDKDRYPIIFVPYHGTAMNRNNRSCMNERYNRIGLNSMRIFE